MAMSVQTEFNINSMNIDWGRLGVGLEPFSIEADPRVQAGGCFIETPSGDIDARLSSQFEVIEQLIRSGEDEGSE